MYTHTHTEADIAHSTPHLSAGDDRLKGFHFMAGSSGQSVWAWPDLSLSYTHTLRWANPETVEWSRLGGLFSELLFMSSFQYALCVVHLCVHLLVSPFQHSLGSLWILGWYGYILCHFGIFTNILKSGIDKKWWNVFNTN